MPVFDYENKVNLEHLTKKAIWARKQILEMCAKTQSGHLASSLSCIEIIIALYYGGVLRFNPQNSKWHERDRFILSKGHGGLSLYPVLADLGFFNKAEINTFCQPGSTLGSHPEANTLGIETITGSLGHGLGIAAGLALAAKMDNKVYKTITLLGDGECYEGSIWEAAMFAGAHNLNNLIAVVDRNGLSVTDFTENFLKLEPFSDKWKSFGWDVVTIDGHSFKEILSAFSYASSRTIAKPFVIIAKTVKSKGISFMEGNPMAHTIVPSGNHLQIARDELEQKHLSSAD